MEALLGDYGLTFWLGFILSVYNDPFIAYSVFRNNDLLITLFVTFSLNIYEIIWSLSASRILLYKHERIDYISIMFKWMLERCSLRKMSFQNFPNGIYTN